MFWANTFSLFAAIMLIEDNWTIYKEEFDALIKRKTCPDDLRKLVSSPHEMYFGLSSDAGIHSLPMIEWRAYSLGENLLAFFVGSHIGLQLACTAQEAAAQYNSFTKSPRLREVTELSSEIQHHVVTVSPSRPVQFLPLWSLVNTV